VECLLRWLGITRTSAYHLQTDAKCERVHFSVLIDDKHERWPDLLGTVALGYNVQAIQRIRGFYEMRYINLRFTYLLTYLPIGSDPAMRKLLACVKWKK